MSAEWHSGICGCFDNCGVCIISFLLPCYQFGQNADAVGDSCCLCCLVSFVPVANCLCRISVRGKMREAQGIDGTCCGDAFYTICCPFCALAQEGIEALHMRGHGMAKEMARE